MNKLMMAAVLAFIPNAFAFDYNCTQQEAQFIGTAKGLTSYEDQYAQTGFCSFQIEYTYFNSSRVCPLDEMETRNKVLSFDLRNETCPVSYEGQQVSGILILKDGNLTIER